MRLTRSAALLLVISSLAACNGQQASSDNADTKKALDQLVQSSKDLNQTAKSAADSAKATSDDVKAMSGKIDELNKSLSASLAGQKRGALYLTLDEDAVCDNDQNCANTARAVCNKINYPNGLTSKFTAGLRPTLHALVCYD